MSLTFIDPANIELRAYFDSDLLCVDCEGVTLPVADPSIVCEVSTGVQVPFSLEFEHQDPNRTITASHYDSTGQLITWSGTNPCHHDFGLTGGFVDVQIEAEAEGQSKITIIKIKTKPKTDKPFRR